LRKRQLGRSFIAGEKGIKKDTDRLLSKGFWVFFSRLNCPFAMSGGRETEGEKKRQNGSCIPEKCPKKAGGWFGSGKKRGAEMKHQKGELHSGPLTTIGEGKRNSGSKGACETNGGDGVKINTISRKTKGPSLGEQRMQNGNHEHWTGGKQELVSGPANQRRRGGGKGLFFVVRMQIYCYMEKGAGEGWKGWGKGKGWADLKGNLAVNAEHLRTLPRRGRRFLDLGERGASHVRDDEFSFRGKQGEDKRKAARRFSEDLKFFREVPFES